MVRGSAVGPDWGGGKNCERNENKEGKRPGIFVPICGGGWGEMFRGLGEALAHQGGLTVKERCPVGGKTGGFMAHSAR